MFFMKFQVEAEAKKVSAWMKCMTKLQLQLQRKNTQKIIKNISATQWKFLNDANLTLTVVHRIKMHDKFARLIFSFYNRCTFEIKEECWIHWFSLTQIRAIWYAYSKNLCWSTSTYLPSGKYYEKIDKSVMILP